MREVGWAKAAIISFKLVFSFLQIAVCLVTALTLCGVAVMIVFPIGAALFLEWIDPTVAKACLAITCLGLAMMWYDRDTLAAYVAGRGELAPKRRGERYVP